MQSNRNQFTFEPIDNIAQGSPFGGNSLKGGSAPTPPPTGNNFLLLGGQPFLLLGGSNFLLLS